MEFLYGQIQILRANFLYSIEYSSYMVLIQVIWCSTYAMKTRTQKMKQALVMSFADVSGLMHLNIFTRHMETLPLVTFIRQKKTGSVVSLVSAVLALIVWLTMIVQEWN